MPRHLSSSQRAAAALCILAAVTCAWLAPLLPHLGSAVLAHESDATNGLRSYWAIEEAGKTPFTFTHDVLNGAPEGVPRARAIEFVSPVQSSFVWTVKELVGRVAALNLFIALGFLLTSFAMFLLLDRFGLGFVPSLFGAYVVGFSPWMFDRAYSGHAAFLHGWVLILALFALVRLRQERTPRWAAVAGAAWGLSFSVAAYLGLLAAALVVAWMIVEIASARGAADRLWTFSLLALSVLVAAVFLLPGAIMFLLDRGTVVRTLTNPLEQLNELAATPLSYLVPSPRHPWLGGIGEAARGPDPLEEKVLFFGYVTLILAGVGVWRARLATGGARALVVLAATVVPIALFASFPRTVGLFGVQVPTPAYLVGEITSFYRVYARFGYVVCIALAVLAAYALSDLRRRRHGDWLAAGALALVVLELLVRPAGAYRIDVAPEHDRWLATHPRGIVAHYPMPTDKREALLLAGHEFTFQPLTGQPLYTIFGAGTGGTREDAIRILSRYLDGRLTPEILAAEQVRYVVVHDDVYRRQRERPPSIPPSLRLLKTFGDVRVFELAATPVDLERTLEQNAPVIARVQGLRPPSIAFGNVCFHAPETFRGEERWRWLERDGELRLGNGHRGPARFRIEGFAFSTRRVRDLELTTRSGVVLARARVGTSMVRLRLGPFRLPEGESVMVMRTNPGPEPLGDTDARNASVYISPLTTTALADYSVSLRRQR